MAESKTVQKVVTKTYKGVDYRTANQITKENNKSSSSKTSGPSIPTQISQPTQSNTQKVQPGYYSGGKFHYYVGNKLYSMPTSQKSTMDREGITLVESSGTYERTIGIPKTTIIPGVITKQTAPDTKLAPGLKVGVPKSETDLKILQTKLQTGSKTPVISKATLPGTKVGDWEVKDTSKSYGEKVVGIDLKASPADRIPAANEIIAARKIAEYNLNAGLAGKGGIFSTIDESGTRKLEDERQKLVMSLGNLVPGVDTDSLLLVPGSMESINYKIEDIKNKIGMQVQASQEEKKIKELRAKESQDYENRLSSYIQGSSIPKAEEHPEMAIRLLKDIETFKKREDAGIATEQEKQFLLAAAGLESRTVTKTTPTGETYNINVPSSDISVIKLPSGMKSQEIQLDTAEGTKTIKLVSPIDLNIIRQTEQPEVTGWRAKVPFMDWFYRDTKGENIDKTNLEQFNSKTKQLEKDIENLNAIITEKSETTFGTKGRLDTLENTKRTLLLDSIMQNKEYDPNTISYLDKEIETAKERNEKLPVKGISEEYIQKNLELQEEKNKLDALSNQINSQSRQIETGQFAGDYETYSNTVDDFNSNLENFNKKIEEQKKVESNLYKLDSDINQLEKERLIKEQNKYDVQVKMAEVNKQISLTDPLEKYKYETSLKMEKQIDKEGLLLGTARIISKPDILKDVVLSTGADWARKIGRFTTSGIVVTAEDIKQQKTLGGKIKVAAKDITFLPYTMSRGIYDIERAESEPGKAFDPKVFDVESLEGAIYTAGLVGPYAKAYQSTSIVNPATQITKLTGKQAVANIAKKSIIPVVTAGLVYGPEVYAVSKGYKTVGQAGSSAIMSTAKLGLILGAGKFAGKAGAQAKISEINDAKNKAIEQMKFITSTKGKTKIDLYGEKSKIVQIGKETDPIKLEGTNYQIQARVPSHVTSNTIKGDMSLSEGTSTPQFRILDQSGKEVTNWMNAPTVSQRVVGNIQESGFDLYRGELLAGKSVTHKSVGMNLIKTKSGGILQPVNEYTELRLDNSGKVVKIYSNTGSVAGPEYKLTQEQYKQLLSGKSLNNVFQGNQRESILRLYNEGITGGTSTTKSMGTTQILPQKTDSELKFKGLIDSRVKYSTPDSPTTIPPRPTQMIVDPSSITGLSPKPTVNDAISRMILRNLPGGKTMIIADTDLGGGTGIWKGSFGDITGGTGAPSTDYTNFDKLISNKGVSSNINKLGGYFSSGKSGYSTSLKMAELPFKTQFDNTVPFLSGGFSSYITQSRSTNIPSSISEPISSSMSGYIGISGVGNMPQNIEKSKPITEPKPNVTPTSELMSGTGVPSYVETSFPVVSGGVGLSFGGTGYIPTMRPFYGGASSFGMPNWNRNLGYGRGTASWSVTNPLKDLPEIWLEEQRAKEQKQKAQFAVDRGFGGARGLYLSKVQDMFKTNTGQRVRESLQGRNNFETISTPSKRTNRPFEMPRETFSSPVSTQPERMNIRENNSSMKNRMSRMIGSSRPKQNRMSSRSNRLLRSAM